VDRGAVVKNGVGKGPAYVNSEQHGLKLAEIAGMT